MAVKAQFFNIRGYPRGGRSKRGTLGSIIAEGLREPTHVSHLLRPPNINWEKLDSPLEHPSDLERWLILQMEDARNTLKRGGEIQHRKLRSDALAIGSFITSWPETIEVYSHDKFSSYVEKTTLWLRNLLDPMELMLHFRLDHFDEKYPHVHYWFSPYPNESRTRNWGMRDVCTNGKRYYHQLQVNFWDNVGCHFFDQRRVPYSERRKRVSRFEAVQRRDAEEREAIARARLEQPTYPLISTMLEKLDELNANELHGPLDIDRLTPNARDVLRRFKLYPDVQELTLSKGISHTQNELVSSAPANPTPEPSYTTTDISRWLGWLLVPTLFSILSDRRSQATHMDNEEWLEFLVEETRYQLESSLREMGLLDHPLASEMVSQFTSRISITDKIQEVNGISLIERSSRLIGDSPTEDASHSWGIDVSPWSNEIPK